MLKHLIYYILWLAIYGVALITVSLFIFVTPLVRCTEDNYSVDLALSRNELQFQ